MKNVIPPGLVTALALLSILDAAGASAQTFPTDDAVLRRGHAVSLMLFNGLPSLPLEQLGEEPTAALHDWSLQRSRIARYALDVLERTDH